MKWHEILKEVDLRSRRHLKAEKINFVNFVWLIFFRYGNFFSSAPKSVGMLLLL